MPQEMTLRSVISAVALLMLALVAGCDGSASTPEATVAPEEPEATNTMPASEEVVTAEPTEPPAASPTATAETAVEEPTATLAPIQATQQALADMVQVPTRENTRQAIAPDDYVALTDQACRIVQENYVRDDFNGVDWQAKCEEYRARAAQIDDQDAFWDMMDSFIAELNDQHSRFVRPDSFAAEFRLPTEGAGRPWPGMRIWPGQEDERLLLWDVCERGPASSAGLQRGDAVLAINGQSVEAGWERDDINRLLYGDDAQSVQLTVLQGPDAQPREVEIAYGGASGCDGWQYGFLSEEPSIGYIRAPSFGGDSDSNIMTLLDRLEEEEPLQGLVVDVRHNPGGNSDKDIAIFTEGTFGSLGPLREDATQSIWRIRGPVKWNETTPMAVLTDGASHSASEYFAIAMKLSGRATLVGMPTAGNTEGISSFNLADGSIIRLAVMTLQLPDGTTLEGSGVQPDVRVPLGDWGLRQQPDVQLQAALDEVRAQIQ